MYKSNDIYNFIPMTTIIGENVKIFACRIVEIWTKKLKTITGISTNCEVRESHEQTE